MTCSKTPMPIIKHRSLVWKYLFVILLVAAPLSASRAQAPNSPKDPYNIEVDRRVTAGTPVPYGIILDARLPYVISFTRDPSPGITGGADFYYDAWQIGVHKTDYGFVGRLGGRTVARDWWGGWYVEFGAGNAGTSDSSYPSTLYGGGYHNAWLFGKGVMYGPEFTFAAGGSSGSGWSDSYIYFTLGMDIRIPIGTSALQLNPTFFAGTRPYVTVGVYDGRAYLDSKSNGYSGISLIARWGFNFE